jgi:hypothetical protein
VKTNYFGRRNLEQTKLQEKHTYLRLWILNKYHSQSEIPILTQIIIHAYRHYFFRRDSGKIKEIPYYWWMNLNDLHGILFFGKWSSFNKFSGYYTTMITSIENNINMIIYNRFYFLIIRTYKDVLDGKSKSKKFRKELYKELNVVKRHYRKRCYAIQNTMRMRIVIKSFLKFDTNYYYDRTI